MSTSDSVDRVFSHALATVRRLPRTGSSRPPPSSRLRLYGLYKQSMEGDVSQILPRPTLPPPSPTQPLEPQNSNETSNTITTPPLDPTKNNTNNATNTNALSRYGSRDLRTREALAEIEKWDAWHACAGMTRTAAKKAYISTLIDTMKAYASGTQESRELVSELEFVWGQVSRSASGGSGSGSGSRGSEEQESPRRSGIMGGGDGVASGTGRRKGVRRKESDGDGDGRMRVLSPVGQSSGANSIVENEEVVDPEDRNHDEDEDGEGEGEEPPQYRSSPIPTRNSTNGTTNEPWRASIEAHLRHLSTEIAALREQLSSQHLLSSSGYSPYVYQNLGLKWRLCYRFTAWVRWVAYLAVRQALLQTALIALVVLYGRWKGDRRVERWVRGRLKDGWGRVRGERPRVLGL